MRIQEQIGQGTTSCVYAMETPDGQQRAVKKVIIRDDDHYRAVLNEQQLWQRCEHPHVVRLLDIDTIGDDVYMVMERLTSLAEQPPTSWREVAVVGEQIGAALAACHQQHIIHRDVKPSNLFRTADGRYQLGDFSVATLRSTAQSVEGTLAYLAPEVVERQCSDERADVYALAIVLYQWSNGGRLPFQEQDDDYEPAIERRLAGEAIPPLPIPAPLNDALLAALRPYDERTATAQALSATFARLREQLSDEPLTVSLTIAHETIGIQHRPLVAKEVRQEVEELVVEEPEQQAPPRVVVEPLRLSVEEVDFDEDMEQLGQRSPLRLYGIPALIAAAAIIYFGNAVQWPYIGSPFGLSIAAFIFIALMGNAIWQAVVEVKRKKPVAIVAALLKNRQAADYARELRSTIQMAAAASVNDEQYRPIVVKARRLEQLLHESSDFGYHNSHITRLENEIARQLTTMQSLAIQQNSRHLQQLLQQLEATIHLVAERDAVEKSQ